jgi:phytoene dehydrogenase-like protein
MQRDVIVIGGGHNSLVAAAFLAKAGFRPLVLERADRVGGCATTSEVVPGFRCPTLAHTASIDPAIVRTLGLERHGLQIVRPASDACVPALDSRALVLWSDVDRAAREIANVSRHDAEQYPRFLTSFRHISGVLRALTSAVPPSIDNPAAADVFELIGTARKFRGLGKNDAYRMLRWMPMPAADLVAEWFESEPLRAVVAAGGTLGSFLGPWSAGSGALLLLLGAGEGHPIATGWFARGGAGAVADALASAAREAGAEIRTSTDVAAIAVNDTTATGVVLADGQMISARAIVSGIDPKQTLLRLVDPVHLEPELVRRVRNIRTRGTLAKVNYACSSLPICTALKPLDEREQIAALSGRVRLASDIDAIERAFDAAKYGGFSDEPWIELTVPSIHDPALAPSGQHVVSAYVQFAPYQLRDTTWDRERDRLGDVATRTISRYAPGFESSLVARQVITPLDLERTYGLTGGQIFHGELALDQLFVTRPLLGWSRYDTPIRQLFLCGSGTHPGTGLNGRSGALAAKEIIKRLRRTHV